MNSPRVDFPYWYSLLRCDASRCGKLRAVENLGDYVLHLFWEEGAEPTIDGLMRVTGD